MKKLLIAVLLSLSGSIGFAQSPYFEAQSGFLTSGFAPVYGIRGGSVFNLWDVSVGYWAARDVDNDRLLSRGADLHTLSAEAYYSLPIKEKLIGKAGGGLGFSIANLNDGVSEQADTGLSWVIGGGVDYALSPKVDLGVSLKSFFFTTDTHATIYSSHSETLKVVAAPPVVVTPKTVEVLDVSHYDNRVNFNSLLFAIYLRWK